MRNSMFFVDFSWIFDTSSHQNRPRNRVVAKPLACPKIVSAVIILVLAYLFNSKIIKSNQVQLPKNIEETFKIAEADKCFDVDYAASADQGGNGGKKVI